MGMQRRVGVAKLIPVEHVIEMPQNIKYLLGLEWNFSMEVELQSLRIRPKRMIRSLHSPMPIYAQDVSHSYYRICASNT